MLLHFLLLLFVFLFHLLRLLLMTLFHLLLPLRRSVLLRRSLMFLLLPLLQLCVFLVLILRQFLLLLPVFLIAIRLSRPVALVRRSILVHRPILIGWTIRRISAAIRRRIVVAASLRCHYAASAKRRRSCRSRDRRLAMILRRAQFTIASRRLYMLILTGHRPDVPFPRRCFFLRRCAHVHSAVAAVVAHPCNIDVVLDVHVVHIANYSFVDVVHFAVVIKMVVIPSSAIISASGVPPAIINTAV